MVVGKADLHNHTTASDGTMSPPAVVARAKAAGLAAVAITDHDTMAGIEEAIAAGERLGIIVVPGIELSTVAGGRDIHVLGYYPDWHNGLWQERLTGLRVTRGRRNEMIIERLVQLGIPATMQEVERIASEQAGAAGSKGKEKTIGRPHIAELLIRKGIVSTMAEAFDRYLADGAAAYANPPSLHPFEAIEWIREAGGTSVIAHPGLYGRDDLVEQLIQKGVQGIEVYHSDHGPDEEKRYGDLARRHGLIITGGSDFHGERQGEVFHGEIGSRTVDAVVLDQLNKKQC
ncbi:PHP domain-containing protein [Paenibacillus glycanilyticus]|uniref:PHP domain-containing protein n=1 Tax=Paenibacillus glycanilyticus TaxID=126569 RepID=UPI00203AD7E0|nr:PHP domain-containing protein [Paenibacillus glycanilyticus]MCM3626329.1 PHP domain-containing protein [Paenibacillus glycanilyticus]